MPDPSDQRPAVLQNKKAIFCHWALASLLVIAFALEIFCLFQPQNFAGWLDAAFIVLAASGILASIWRQLPLQNVLLAVLGIAAIGGGFSVLGARTDLPFGPFLYTSGIGPLIFKTLPWVMPLIWVAIVLNSRGVARLMLRPWRKNKTYGFRVIGLTALLALLFDIAFEPYAFRVKDYWHWLPTKLPLTWMGAPIINFVAWGLITVLILLFTMPVLIVKKPRPKSGPDYYPLCAWFGAIVLCGTGCAVKGIWPPVIADAVIGIGAAFFALRGALW